MKRIRTAAVLLCAFLLTTFLLGSQLAMAATKSPGRTVPPRFTDETASAGVDHAYEGEWQFFVGGGVAVMDCDDDARPDLLIAGGAEPAALFRNRSQTAGPLRFERAASAATALSDVTGAYPLDIDSDGIGDIAVLRRGENVLLRGLGDCAFERANERWDFDGGNAWTVGFSAKWDPGASMPTLAVGNYLTVVEPGEASVCDDSALYQPDASGRYAAPTPLSPGYCALSMLFSDWDRSGRTDLRVANDRHYNIDGEDQLWRIEPGTAPRPWTREEGWQRLRVWGMGIASQDLGGDGHPEVYVTSMGDNKLQTLVDGSGQPRYQDIAFSRGVTAHRPFLGGEALPSTAWHAEFDDVNNDGRMDLFVSKGNVEAMPDHATKDPNNLLLGTGKGKFREAAKPAGLVDFERSRGGAVADLNQDGLLDIVVVERRAPVRLWRNVGTGSARRPKPMGDWLAIELAQDGPNVDAIGSWIEVRSGGAVMEREVTVGGGHASGQSGPTHFGLGDASKARVRVIWPDGQESIWADVPVNHQVVLQRPDGEACAEACVPPEPIVRATR